MTKEREVVTDVTKFDVILFFFLLEFMINSFWFYLSIVFFFIKNHKVLIEFAWKNCIQINLSLNQVSEIRAVRHARNDRIKEEEMTTASLLTADELLKLRSSATIHCTVPEHERVSWHLFTNHKMNRVFANKSFPICRVCNLFVKRQTLINNTKKSCLRGILIDH